MRRNSQCMWMDSCRVLQADDLWQHDTNQIKAQVLIFKPNQIWFVLNRRLLRYLCSKFVHRKTTGSYAIDVCKINAILIKSCRHNALTLCTVWQLLKIQWWKKLLGRRPLIQKAFAKQFWKNCWKYPQYA